MAFLAITMFVVLVAFGRDYFGWSDPGGNDDDRADLFVYLWDYRGMKARG